MKAQIAAEVSRLVQVKKLTQAKAGALLGIYQSEVSRLFKGHFREYPVERLMNFLAAMGQGVGIRFRPPPSWAAAPVASKIYDLVGALAKTLPSEKSELLQNSWPQPADFCC
ncbi:hypothetical protein MesoLj131b_76630 (plasmid) [Mesorhizobium sp. 131-2-5]|uniref:helix-turn-helix domain-containing protein n=1 Tax=Mesorhizobium sp. 131-2-5 TaxID=2744519 RepID=UPI0018EC40B4|nr:helix-turn-helix transcriptional regulator [Mesorhizobium sp. 131-2-5]BCH05664.1 hypothetical protein MesoLj131b_76630 [Mesorhizobium sp. 131-2-5]